MTTIGVISDTHGLLDPRVPEIFAKVDHILHAGDIGYPSIILELEDIAPTTAVLGNNDAGLDFRETELAQIEGRKFLVHHIVDPKALTPTLQRRMERDVPDVVVFGHTHKPFNEQIGKTLFFNPGYSGKPKFNLRRTVALLHCSAEEVRAEFVDL